MKCICINNDPNNMYICINVCINMMISPVNDQSVSAELLPLWGKLGKACVGLQVMNTAG